MNKKKNLRIGLFTDVYYPSISGVVVAVDTLKKALEKEGHKVFIITVNSENKSHKYIRKNNCIMIPGVPTNIYDYSIRVTYPLKAVKIIKSLKLDIIHAHTEFGIGTFAKSMAKKLNIPMIHTYHTLYDLSLDYITKGYFPNTSKKILKAYMKLYFSNTINEVIVPSNKTKESLEQFYKIHQNISVIPNGINVDRFKKENINLKILDNLRKKYQIDENDFVTMWVGRLGYEKRIDILIEGYVDVIKNYPNAKLMIVGTGPEEDNLKDIAKKQGIEENCIFTGKISYDDVPSYYQLASIISTASHYETQGLTIIEGFGASKPVLCINDESFKNIVINGYNGMVFKTKKEYTKLVKYFIENPNIVKEMENNARIFSNKYSLKTFASAVLDVYYKALEEKTIKNNK